jgi:very-short-patch-repair endonuclease
MRRKRPLRRDVTIHDLLWLGLRELEDRGWHFRKNSPFRTFLLPFAEHDALLVVELETDWSARNAVRDRLLREAGYTILRFPQADTEDDLSGVLTVIRAILEDRKT